MVACAWGFQFTPLREGRPDLVESNTLVAVFQFTPLREGRLRPDPAISFGADFNSRPCVRGDAARLSAAGPANISIHAPA